MLAATHLLLDVDDGAMRVEVLLESASARMAKPSPSRANMPVSMMEVKEMVTGPGMIDGSAYFFARNVLTLPGAAVSGHIGLALICGTQHAPARHAVKQARRHSSGGGPSAADAAAGRASTSARTRAFGTARNGFGDVERHLQGLSPHVAQSVAYSTHP